MRFIRWLSTDAGRSFTFRGVAVIGIGVACLNFFPHSCLLHKYMEVIQTYRHGYPVPVSSSALKLMEVAMADMNIPLEEQNIIKPFTVIGFDVFHAGSTYMKPGAIIGIPSNFSYVDESDVDQQIVVNNRQVPWKTSAGQNLKSALVLSDSAKKFAIAREIAMVRTPYVYLNSTHAGFVVFFTYSLARYYNNKLGLLSKPLWLRMIFYSLCGSFGFGLWAFLKDYTTVYYEQNADHTLCKLGKEYIKGGIEFYTKLLEKNKSVRELMNSAGEKLYTSSGNQKFLIRNKHLPILLRKQFLESQLHENNDSSGITSFRDGDAVVGPSSMSG